MFPEYDSTHPLWWDNPVPDVPKASGAIPKTIHQLWIGPKKRPQKLMETWRDKNPGWNHIIWSEDNLTEFTWRNQRHIDAMPEWNGKADIMRYEILHKYGGVFMDADSECLQPLDDFFLAHDCWACLENESQRGALVACGIMATVPGCRLMELCIKELEALPKDVGTPAWWTVGPVFFTWVIHKHLYSDIHLYPGHWFIPNHYTGQTYTGTDKVYADHKWGTAMHRYGELD